MLAKTKTLFLLSVVLACAEGARAQGTAFTYQGQLTADTTAAQGDYDFRFRLVSDTGVQVPGTPTLIKTPVTVSGGSFTVLLDFGRTAFTGPDRWLEIGVRAWGDPSDYTTLWPLQALTPTPYAIFSATAANVLSGSVTAPALGTRNQPEPGQVLTYNGAELVWSHAEPAAGSWSLTGNIDSNPETNFLGTRDAQPLELRVNNGRALRLEPNADGAVNVIGGSSNNVVQAGVAGATIGGGGANGYLETVPALSGYLNAGPNQVLADFSGIAGGADNTIGDSSIFSAITGGAHNGIQEDCSFSFIGGGHLNTVEANSDFSTIAGGLLNSSSGVGNFIGGGGFNADLFPNNFAGNIIGANASVIGGGFGNAILLGADYGFIGSGWQNTIGSSHGAGGPIYSVDAIGATVAGGVGNTSIASYSTIPGGFDNYVVGAFGLAAGRRAKSLHEGAFVWADATDADFASSGNNQFAIRARGGVRLSEDTPSLSFGSKARQMLNLWGTNYGIGVQTYMMYFRSDGGTYGGNGFAWYLGGSHSNAPRDPGGDGQEVMFLDYAGLVVNGTLVSSSDRNSKENFAPLNTRVILDKVLALPLSEWSYKKDPGTRHLGPMAQDFRAAFAVGQDDKHIATVDADGVALAAIQALHALLQEKDEQLKTQGEALEALGQRLDRLEGQLTAHQSEE